MPDRIVLVTGATGKQGGALIRNLLGRGFKLRGLTRKPDGEPARALKSLGVEIVKGDFDDPASLEAPLHGAWGMFSVQNTWEAGVEREEEQGLRLAQMAREAGIQHFVYGSVASAHRKSGIPHFENKWRIENRVRQLKFRSHAILRPVFFMENLPSPWFLNGDQIFSALAPTTKLQMVAVDDVGRVLARLFTDAADMKGREIDLAGDVVTMTRAAEVLGARLGRTIRYVQIPMDEVRKSSPDFALMLEWFERVGYNADIPALEKEFGPLTRIEAWAAQAVQV